MQISTMVACALAVGVGAAWFVVVRTIAAHRQTLEAHARLRGAFELLLTETERARWAEWWARCAAETTLADPARPLVIRWAFAAHLAPTLDQLHCDMRAIAGDEQRSETERVHAQAFCDELALRQRTPPSTAWFEWMKQPAAQGRPVHNEHAIAGAYCDALRSWDALLRPLANARNGALIDRPANSIPAQCAQPKA